MNATNSTIAGVAVISPWWLPYLEQFSQVAGLLLPIAGLIYLVIQIIGYLAKNRIDK